MSKGEKECRCLNAQNADGSARQCSTKKRLSADSATEKHGDKAQGDGSKRSTKYRTSSPEGIQEFMGGKTTINLNDEIHILLSVLKCDLVGMFWDKGESIRKIYTIQTPEGELWEVPEPTRVE